MMGRPHRKDRACTNNGEAVAHQHRRQHRRPHPPLFRPAGSKWQIDTAAAVVISVATALLLRHRAHVRVMPTACTSAMDHATMKACGRHAAMMGRPHRQDRACTNTLTQVVARQERHQCTARARYVSLALRSRLPQTMPATVMQVGGH
jgi:hypothetical protein